MAFILSQEKVRRLLEIIEKYPPYEDGEEIPPLELDGDDRRYNSTIARELLKAHVANGGTI